MNIARRDPLSIFYTTRYPRGEIHPPFPFFFVTATRTDVQCIIPVVDSSSHHRHQRRSIQHHHRIWTRGPSSSSTSVPSPTPPVPSPTPPVPSPPEPSSTQSTPTEPENNGRLRNEPERSVLGSARSSYILRSRRCGAIRRRMSVSWVQEWIEFHRMRCNGWTMENTDRLSVCRYAEWCGEWCCKFCVFVPSRESCCRESSNRTRFASEWGMAFIARRVAVWWHGRSIKVLHKIESDEGRLPALEMDEGFCKWFTALLRRGSDHLLFSKRAVLMKIYVWRVYMWFARLVRRCCFVNHNNR